jgi:hypothetical protein
VAQVLPNELVDGAVNQLRGRLIDVVAVIARA